MPTFLVPASTTNLGPGFDCLGMALQLYNEVTVEPGGDALAIAIEGDGAHTLPRDEANLVHQALACVFRALDRPVPALRLHLVNRIPLRRGLGSSAAGML